MELKLHLILGMSMANRVKKRRLNVVPRQNILNLRDQSQMNLEMHITKKEQWYPLI